MIREKSNFSMQLFKPAGRNKTWVQALWSVASAQGSEKQWLHGDGCSGLLFILSGTVWLDGQAFSTGVYLLPTGDQAHTIALAPGTQIAGIRFQPGICSGIFHQTVSHPTRLESTENRPDFSSLFHSLQPLTGHRARLRFMFRWISTHLEFSGILPRGLSAAISLLTQNAPGCSLLQQQAQIPVCRRQLERQFRRHLGLTPKQYQRVIRVKILLEHLRQSPDSNLATLALEKGFADQAHMTREVRHIAKITPRRFAALVKARQF